MFRKGSDDGLESSLERGVVVQVGHVHVEEEAVFAKVYMEE